MKKVIAFCLAIVILSISVVAYAYDTSSQNYSGSCISYVTTTSYNNLPSNAAWMSVTSKNTFSRLLGGSPCNHKIWATSGSSVQMSSPSDSAGSGGTAIAYVTDTPTAPIIKMTMYNYIGGGTMIFEGKWYASYGYIAK